MKNKQMYEISLTLFYSFFLGGGGGGGGGGGIYDYFANFARDISLNAVVMSNFTSFSPPPPPPPTPAHFLSVYPSLQRSPNPFLFFKF